MSMTSDPAIVALNEPKGSLLDSKFEKSSPGKWGAIGFAAMLLIGVIYIGHSLTVDLSVVHSATVFPYILLGLALFIALGFEFVNGFHDTANAVATCIYTHSLEPHIAVVYSGIMNFIGVLLSSGPVAFSDRQRCFRSSSSSRSPAAPASPWSLPCSSRPSFGTSPPGSRACPPPARTP